MLRTRITDFFGIERPIVQGGLMWIARAELVSAVSNAGGIGFIQEAAWGQAAALAGCALSLFSIVPWWRSVAPGAKFGAIFDVLAIIFLLTPFAGRIF